ncbi:MAG TPA: DUF4395 domain-containing protein [Nocardioidaceae bacterium]|nr:DUF4395 domain-containing protein [Nocardioidaceae bacterium]
MSAQIDPRGQRFTASVNLAGFAVALLAAPSRLTEVLLAVLGVGFLLGTVLGPQHTPWAFLFKKLIRPRIGAPKELEDAAPPRFAAAVGLAFTGLALVGYLSGATLLGAIATGFALAAAFLNAVFGFCLGCEIYLLARRLAPAPEKRAGSPVAH